MKRLAVVVVLMAALVGTATAAPARNINLLRAFAVQLPKVKKSTTVPVLLPALLPTGGTYKVYGTGYATKSTWNLELDGAPNCGGANACFIAGFEGKRGGKLPGKANARLAAGDPAFFLPFSCGGSCSPDSFYFTHRGVLYSWQGKDLPKNPKALLVRLANEAIAAGPR